MSSQKLQVVISETLRAVAIGAIFGLTLMVMYLAFEPVLGRAITDEFTVSQEITGEISFSTAAADVTMLPAIASLTGGTSTGATQVVVSSNSITGYTMDISFSSSTAMNQNTGSSSIPNYTPEVVTVPDFDFQNVPANSAEFGYTVEASTTSDVDPSFLDNGSLCNTGSNHTADQCWLNPSTTDERIISRSNIPPVSGATTTIKFQLVVNPNPSPALPADFYTATATLTALNQ